MDWLIWVIVIVLIVAIVWWLLSRNSAKSSSAPAAPASPAASSPVASSPAASSPQMDVAAAALTGSAPLVAATATADQELAESRAAEPEPAPVPSPEPEPEPESGPEGSNKSNGLDVDDWERPVPPLEAGTAAPKDSSASGTSVEEPVVEEPRLSEPVLSEDAVSEELEGGVTADDVTAADSAEWEATWSEGGVPAASAPVHHREYTDAHAPTLPGAESAAAEAVESNGPEEQATSALGGHLAAEQPYGEGSAAAGPDGSGPEGYTVKGNADTMTYHDEDSPSYDEAKAEVWFISSAHAEAAGFRPPRRNRR